MGQNNIPASIYFDVRLCSKDFCDSTGAGECPLLPYAVNGYMLADENRFMV